MEKKMDIYAMHFKKKKSKNNPKRTLESFHTQKPIPNTTASQHAILVFCSGLSFRHSNLTDRDEEIGGGEKGGG